MTRIIHTIDEFRRYRAGVPGGVEVAFVPTMGALHEGHASLVREARRVAPLPGVVVSSIFVNPTQFGPSEDFSKYPRTLEADVALLEAAGCDAVFVPSAQEMYGTTNLNAATQGSAATVDPGPLATVLEGEIRPGHFRGVCTVVLKLLNIVAPTKLVMGQKDFQQNAVLRAMIRDLNVATEHVMCPTIREADGLAMSSRNRYLAPEQRVRAVGIYHALTWAAGAVKAGERSGQAIGSGMRKRIEAAGLTVQYALPAHPDTLAPYRNQIDGPCVLLVAAVLGTTRLIDNMRI